MAKVVGPLFSMSASGAFGSIVFDKRGFARPKGNYRDRQSTSQGDFRQTLTVAQRCVKVCGPTTRQLIKNIADVPSRWNGYLVKFLIGPNRANYTAYTDNFSDTAVDQASWETAAASISLPEVVLNYADDVSVSPGLQLFMLASTLFQLGIYTPLGQPAANAEIWKESIIS
ncbi:MAG: hypothetical protein HYR94_09555 [Chloroflexi bacterium]|nr:hypothetical protein [Chloroflexota bacterium]